MTVGELLKVGTGKLHDYGIATARLDCLVLLEDILNTNRTQILAHPERELSHEQQNTFNSWIKRRSAQEPLSYIRKKTEFYGYEFYIDHHVLEPRPESETIIDLLKALPSKPNTIIADIGTGSGALAITAEIVLPQAAIFASDVDISCLRVAKKNAKLLNASINFLHGNLLEPFVQKPISPDILLCNLPYVPDNFQINPAAMREPRLAIFGGHDGLDIYRQLFDQIQRLSTKPAYILTESLPPQHGELTKIAQNTGYVLQYEEDFIQLFTR